jgi:hypothetical protein
MIGHGLEPLLAPVGFNWQIAIALVPGLAAREVAVAALGTVYALSGDDGTVTEALGRDAGPRLDAGDGAWRCWLGTCSPRNAWRRWPPPGARPIPGAGRPSCSST